MPATFKALKRRLNELPTKVATAVAERARPALTALAGQAFDAGRDVYGAARPKSEVDGHTLTLRKTGDAEKSLRFAGEGTIVRAVLARPYLKYLIGKYRILPNGPLPVAWRSTLDSLVKETKAP